MSIRMTGISNDYAIQITSAVRKRLEKINSYVLDHPSCSFSDIYKHSVATTNYEDLKGDIDYLILIGDFIRTKATGKFFKEPIKNGFLDIFLFYQMLDDIVNVCKYSPNFQKTKIARQIKHITPPLNNSNISKLIDTYKHGIDQTSQEIEQLLSKIIIILLQKSRILTSEIKGTERKRKAMHSRLIDFHKTQNGLMEEQLKNTKTSKNKNSTHYGGDLAKERRLRDAIHAIDWKRYIQSSNRSDSSLKIIGNLVGFLQLFLKDYDFSCKYFSSSNSITKEFSDNFDQIFDNDKLYNSTLKSTTRRSLKELIQIQNSLFLECNEEKLAIYHGYKYKKNNAKCAQGDSG